MHIHEDGLRVNRWSMLYHHAMDRSVVQFHPEFRLLTDEELNEVKPFSSGNCRTDRIKSYVVKRFGKHIITEDVSNMKRNYCADGLPQSGIN